MITLSKPKSRFKLKFRQLAKPSGIGVSAVEAFLAYQWMASTVPPNCGERVGRWNVYSPWTLLNATSANADHYFDFSTEAELRRRFQYVLLEPAPTVKVHEWRQKNGIHYDAEKWITGDHGVVVSTPGLFGFAAKTSEDYALKSLLEYSEDPKRAHQRRLAYVSTHLLSPAAKGTDTIGPRLAVSLNTSHPSATELGRIVFKLSDWNRTFRWSFELAYHLEGSVWHYTLARQRPGERIGTAASRALRVLHELTHNPRAAILHEAYDGHDSMDVYRMREGGIIEGDPKQWRKREDCWDFVQRFPSREAAEAFAYPLPEMQSIG